MFSRILCLLILGLSAFAPHAQVAENGLVDLKAHDYVSSPTISLNGEWKFYPSIFIDPSEKVQFDNYQLLQVPERWEQAGLSAFGYGSYQLTILKRDNVPLALKIPDLFSAYRLYVNDQHLASMGVPGVDKKSEKPGRQSKLVPLGHIQSDTLNVVIHISNFVHRKGGIGAPIYIGDHHKMTKEKFLQDSYDLFLAGSLVLGAFFFLGLFFFGQHEKMALYFALFCLIYAYRVVGWGNYVLNDLIDVPYHLSIRIEFATLYLTVIIGFHYIKNLYPKETPSIVVKVFSAISILWTASTLLPVRVFTHFNIPYVFVLLVAMVIICIIFIRAIANRRLGANYSAFSLLGITAVFAMKALAYIDLVEEVLWISMLGQLMFFFFQSLILSKNFTESWRIAKDEAESAVKVRSDFLSVMSHEIRTPLNTVIGTTYHLLDENPKKEQVEELSNLKNASEYLLTLINNVLDFSKIDEGKLEFDEANTALKSYCEDIFNIFKPTAEKKGILLQFEYDDQLPDVVKLDKVRVNQILTNLIGNAIKFTEEGHVKLKVSQVQKVNSQVDVHFEIQDTGIGISDDIRDRIFQSFQQANTSITRKYGGTGLGLSITKQLVELMGSRINLDSEEGKGSVFSFTLSLKIGNKLLERLQQKEFFDLSGYKVLLVEDNQMNILIAKRLLEKWKMDVELANNGLEALEKVDNTFDIVLMDLQMPEMDGYEATKIIRKRGYTFPVIALTASAMFEKSSKLEAAGLDGLVTKPFNPKDLYRAISDRLEKK